MTICIFLGPTLPLTQARARLDAIYLPPARHGDIYRAATFWQPHAIGIIDGYFHQVPAVCHKEILWAMSNSIHVFGSASMGALRAAELAPFGMIGVGRIFEAYRDGVLHPYGKETFEDDDEVTVIHGPAETGYVSISEALVNIRCTLAQAARNGIIDDDVWNTLARIGKQTFYQKRSYRYLLECTRGQGMATSQLNALQNWLPTGAINQKAIDALAMLDAMRKIGPEPMSVHYSFQHTMTWDETIDAVDVGDDLDTQITTRILDEFRREENNYRQMRQQVIHRLLAQDERIVSDQDTDSLAPYDSPLGKSYLAAATVKTAQHRATLGTFPTDTESVSPDQAYDFMTEGLRRRGIEGMADQLPELLIDLHIIRCLRESGHFEDLLRRISLTLPI
jgi:hypothetical protein